MGGATSLTAWRFRPLPDLSEHGHAHAHWRLSLIPAKSPSGVAATGTCGGRLLRRCRIAWAGRYRRGLVAVAGGTRPRLQAPRPRPGLGLPALPRVSHPRAASRALAALASLRDGLRPPLTRPGVPGPTGDGDQAGHTPGDQAMHESVEVAAHRCFTPRDVGPREDQISCWHDCTTSAADYGQAEARP
jgi:hypothetical protein